MEKEIKANSQAPAVQKPAVKKSCCSLDGQHWLVLLFLASAAAAFIMTLGVVMANPNGHRINRAAYTLRGNDSCGMGQACSCQCGQTNGACPMAAAREAGQIASIPAVNAPAAINPYSIKDITDIFSTTGTVASMNDDGIVVADANNIEKNISITKNTKVVSADTEVKLSDIKTGDKITVINLPDADGTMSAQLIRILAQ